MTTASSTNLLARAADVARARQGGFHSILSRCSPPVTHGLASAARVTGWKVVSACHLIAVAAETSMLRSHIVTHSLTSAARKGAVTVKPAES